MSAAHLIVIAVIALIVLGPEKLPQVARTLGKAMAEFRRITGDFRATVEGEMREMERTVALKELREGLNEDTGHSIQERQQQEAVTAAAAASQDPVLPPITPAHDTTTGPTSATIPTFEHLDAPETEAATASGKPSDGKPTSV